MIPILKYNILCHIVFTERFASSLKEGFPKMKRISVKNMSEELYILETIVGWKSATLLKKRFLQKWVFSSQMILLRF